MRPPLADAPLVEPGPETVIRHTKVKVRCEDCGLVQRNTHAGPGTGSHLACRRCGHPYGRYA